MGLLIGCTVASALLTLRTGQQAKEGRVLRKEMQSVRMESGRWRKEMKNHLQGFGAAIQKQFGDWRPSKAEQDVGLLLLKGFSHKEIARIRQQAGSIYHKAGLGGREACLSPRPKREVGVVDRGAKLEGRRLEVGQDGHGSSPPLAWRRALRHGWGTG
ncbi:MAG: hypothetical protein KDG89_15885 [Geminicoccaceae bacterium]|nr:hypothetical protein [Geminicoccaceae bacterium]